jgi:hypothetical protein
VIAACGLPTTPRAAQLSTLLARNSGLAGWSTPTEGSYCRRGDSCHFLYDRVVPVCPSDALLIFASSLLTATART